MAGIIVVDRIESDASYASSINIASPVIISNTFAFPAGSAAAPAISPTGDTNTGIFFPAADTIAFAEGGAESVRIDSAGRVGIDQTSPSEKLDIWTNRTGGDGAIVLRTQFGAHYFGGVGNYPAFGYKIGSTFHAALGYDTNNSFLFTGPDSAKQPAFLARAWVNFNGTGTVAIRGSGNVSSITDLGTGQYRMNFSTVMPDTNYCVVSGDEHYGLGWDDTYQTTSVVTRRFTTTFSYVDVGQICISVFR